MTGISSTELMECIENKIVSSWNEINGCLDEISGNHTFCPSHLTRNADFKIIENSKKDGEEDEEDSIKVTVNPIILKFPEKSNELVVHIDGYLLFNKPFKKNDLKIIKYETRMNIYRKKNKELNQIYGVHYDFEPNSTDHPRYHAQFCDKIIIDNDNLRKKLDIEKINNFIDFKEENMEKYEKNKIFGDSRIPTARLDIFSTFAQLCADHLLPNDINTKKDGDNERVMEEFNKLKDACCEIKCTDCTMPIKLWYAG